jgi:hypothetical protein
MASSIHNGKDGRLYIPGPDSVVVTSVFFSFYAVLGHLHLPEQRLEFAGKGREKTARFRRIQADRTMRSDPKSLSVGHVKTGWYTYVLRTIDGVDDCD